MHRNHLQFLVTALCIMLLSSNLVFAANPSPIPVPDRGTSAYRLSKYDVLNIVILGFGDSFLKPLSLTGDSNLPTNSMNQTGNLGLNDIMIGPDGYVNLPYAGSVKLSGLTIPEATKILSEKLGEYIKIPGMTVMVKSYGPRKVYVMGEVVKPGIYDVSWERMNVMTAISSAGGIGLRGHPEHVHIVRMTENTMDNREVNFKKLVEKGDLTQNIEIQDGDLVYVPHSRKIDFNTDILPFLNAFFLYKAATN